MIGPLRPPASLWWVRRTAVTLIASATLLACGSEGERTPTACLQGPDSVAAALEGAPAEARIDGEVPLADCLVKDQPAGTLNTVGNSWITVASDLNRQAREARSPERRAEAATRLGFLVGSAEQAASETAGIHNDLVLRLNSAARFTEDGGTTSAAFERRFGAGYAAARES